MSPAAVQSVYVVVPLAIAATSSVGTALARRIGRVEAVLTLRISGLACFGAMVVLYDRGIARDGSMKWVLVAVFVARTALMNAPYPLEESILMDYVPKAPPLTTRLFCFLLLRKRVVF